MPERTRFLLSEEDIPTHWVNLLPDLPGDPLPPLHPGHARAGRPRRPARHLPAGLSRRRSRPTAASRSPSGPRRLQPVAADAAVPRPPARAGARHPRAHLLQVRGRLAGRLAQAQHRGRAGLRERPGRDAQARDGDRGRPVGLRARVRLRAVRARVRGLHGRLELRPEALPALDHGDVGRHGAPLAERSHAGGSRAGGHPTGSLGIAISEAVEVAAGAGDTNYSLGSVLNHVCCTRR